MPPNHFTEPTTSYWQHIVDAGAVPRPDAPWQFGYPARLPDGRVLMLPIRPLANEPTHAVASLLLNQASLGVVEVLGYGVPVGLGSHVHWDRKIDAALAQALMSIQAIKGVEIGDGFDVAGRRGSDAHDAIVWDAEANGGTGNYRRLGALAGGVEGGITTGELLVARAAMKPLATLNRPTLQTVDVVTKESTVSFKERTDVTAVPAAGVVAETMVALVLAAEAQRKFGGDTVAEFVRNAEAFRATLP